VGSESTEERTVLEEGGLLGGEQSEKEFGMVGFDDFRDTGALRFERDGVVDGAMRRGARTRVEDSIAAALACGAIRQRRGCRGGQGKLVWN
jgi:hypothetical protein